MDCSRPHFQPDQLAAWCTGQWLTPCPQTLSGVRHDSRAVQDGDLFVAIAGPNYDGHNFITQAVEAGAVAVLVNADRVADITPEIPQLAVPDTRKALMDLARGHRECYGGTVVAITGSSGKTTVKEMVADVLATKGSVERTPGNWNNDIGIPLGLLAMSREADCWVLEAGMNHPGELAPLFEVIRPAWGIVTNVGPVHLEFFDNVAAIAVEKASLVRALPPEGGLVLSVDGAWTDVLLQDAVCRVVRVSMHEAVDAAYLGQPDEGSLVTFSGPEDSCECTMPLPGDYVMQDALLAYALGRELGVPAEAASQALAHYHPLALRWNRSERHGRIFINDAYNANPMSMRAALRAFRRVPAEHHWLVLGGMLELGDAEREEHLSLGREIAYGSWRGLLTVGQPGDVIAEGAESEGFAAEQTVRCETPEMAARVLADRMQPGDAALLKASRSVGLEGVLKAWPDDA